MAIYKRQNGLFLPVEKEKPVKKERPKIWNCPWCGVEYDSTKQEHEEYTVGSLRSDAIPHIICPNCKECMGCLGRK